jgi:hypothetical protein
MKPYFRPLIAATLFCVAHRSAAAQTRSDWSVQGSGLYAAFRGSAHRGVKPGGGFELQARRKLNQYWSLGCGVQDTHHSLSDGFLGNETLQGLFCEPRRLVDINSEHFFPYFSSRAAVLRQQLESGDITRTARGVALNIGTGLLMPFMNTRGNYPTLFEVGVSGGFTNFGDFTTTQSSQTAGNTVPHGAGWNYVVRVGLAVGLPFGSSMK